MAPESSSGSMNEDARQAINQARDAIVAKVLEAREGLAPEMLEALQLHEDNLMELLSPEDQEIARAEADKELSDTPGEEKTYKLVPGVGRVELYPSSRIRTGNSAEEWGAEEPFTPDQVAAAAAFWEPFSLVKSLMADQETKSQYEELCRRLGITDPAARDRLTLEARQRINQEANQQEHKE